MVDAVCLMVPSSGIMMHASWFHGLWLMAHRSWRIALGSWLWLMAHGEKGAPPVCKQQSNGIHFDMCSKPSKKTVDREVRNFTSCRFYSLSKESPAFPCVCIGLLLQSNEYDSKLSTRVGAQKGVQDQTWQLACEVRTCVMRLQEIQPTLLH